MMGGVLLGDLRPNREV